MRLYLARFTPHFCTLSYLGMELKLLCLLQGRSALLSVAVSDDGRMLAVGGGDRIVHVWDARSRQYVQVWLRHGWANSEINMIQAKDMVGVSAL